jgi:uncharacterized membrane protein YdbT with pleckstrin-like domain
MKNLHKRSIWLFFLQGTGLRDLFGLYILLNILFGVLGSGYLVDAGESKMLTIIVVGLIILAVALAYVVAYLRYRFYHYELTDGEFRKESGIISKKYVSIPYERIQNVEITRRLVARILGLSELEIQTASGVAKAEGHLPGLSTEEAESIRTELISRSRQSNNPQGTGQVTPPVGAGT